MEAAASVESLLSICSKYLEFDRAAALKLHGGYLNEVWRVDSRTDGTVILKCYPPYIASNPSHPLSAARYAYEMRALQWVWSHGRTLHITVPRVLHVLPAVPCLVLQDAGTGRTLEHVLAPQQSMTEGAIKAAARTASAIGMSLGHWLAQLHTLSSLTPHREELQAMQHNVGIQVAREEGQYQAVAAVVSAVARECGHGSQYDALASALHPLWQAVGRAWRGPGVCLIHGDLWPRSLLVRGEDEGGSAHLPTRQVDNGLSSPSCSIIDWEFSSWGWPGQDVAHLAAHVWMAGHAWSRTEGWVTQPAAAATIDSDDAYGSLDRLMWGQWAAVGVTDAKLPVCPPVAFWVAFMAAYRKEWAAGIGNSQAFACHWREHEAEQRQYSSLHWAAEILARVGTWRSGYLYEHATQDMLMEAVQAAAAVRELACA